MLKFIFMMIFLFLWMILFMMILFILLKSLIHPITLMISMIIYNAIVCYLLSMWSSNYIFSMLIFLILISGLLIIFMYFSSLISNEQINFLSNTKKLMLMFISISIASIFFLKMDFFMNFLTFNFQSIYPINFLFMNKFNNIMILYNYPLMNFSLLMILFITIAFFSIIKINSSSHSYSIRKII